MKKILFIILCIIPLSANAYDMITDYDPIKAWDDTGLYTLNNELLSIYEALRFISSASSGSYTAGDFLTLTGSDFDLDYKDEDNMVSNSATHVPTQQSVKAYVDGKTTGSIIVTFDGGGAVIAANSKWYGVVPFGITVNAWYIIADASGAIKLDVWVHTWSNIPTNTQSVTNGHEPEIAASGQTASDTDISDWSDVSYAATNTIVVNVDSCTTITKATLVILYDRS